MRAILAASDQLLRDLGRPAAQTLERHWRTLAAAVLIAGAAYGAFMGSFAWSPERSLLMLYAAAKVPLLILTTTLICLPGFFVLSTIAGVRTDFTAAMRSILAGQAALTIALASLGPLTRFIYISGASYRAALLFNGAMFAIATVAAQIVAARRSRRLTSDPSRGTRHRLLLRAWTLMYIFVGIQMAWMLRPFVGSPEIPVAFFRPEPFSNAYIEVARLILGH